MAKVFQSMDGNQAAAWCSYAFTEVAGIYPITPSSPMAEFIDLWASQGKKNLFGVPVRVVEMESEAGAAGAVHGSLQAGSLTTTYTASQGLLLKIPNMYKIAGQLLPGVIHVAARSLAAQSLSIFGDHQDVMAARQTGFAIMFSGSVQEVMDCSGIAHLAAIKSSVPFLNAFDGFRTSHEVNKVEVMDYEVFDRLLDKDAVKAFRARSLNPQRPITRGSAQNDDVYFQTKEVQNQYYDRVPDIVNDYMQEISKVTGRDYAPFNYYGDPEATDIIVAMGSVTETIIETIDYLRKEEGRKVGLLIVRLFRPFSEKYFFNVLPKTVERVAVLDRCKEPGANGEPLYLDVKNAFYGKEHQPQVIGGRYGLSSKDTTPNQIVAVYNNLAGEMKNNFTIGINDDVTHLSLELPTELLNTCPEGTTELLFFGLGSDGTVGACKNIIKIIGDNTDLYGQAYASYDSKKSGGVTRMHLRFGKKPIRSTYLVNNPHFVSLSQFSYLDKYDVLGGIRPNGTFLLNTSFSGEELERELPNNVKKILAERNIKFYTINAEALAQKAGLGRMINTIMQSAFFKLNEHIMEYSKAQDLMKYMAKKTYSKKGEEVVLKNYAAIDSGSEGLVQVEVKPEWANLEVTAKAEDMSRPDFVRRIADPVNHIKGDTLPVSTFQDYADGKMIQGTTAYEKRGTAVSVPVWNPENCIQCNQCSYVCPHAAIRPFLIDENEMAKKPEGAETLPAMGKDFQGLQYRIQVSALDCTGCGVCVSQCPGKKGEKALTLVPIHEAIEERGEVENAKFFYNEVTYKDNLVDKTANPKNLQFAQPLFEFSGACAGCGETPYIKAVTQLFGDRMIIANATGCTSIYGGSYPSTPYTTNAEGHGPAWANSLFEDNAEFGFGMRISYETARDQLAVRLENLAEKSSDSELAELTNQWEENRTSATTSAEIAPKLIAKLESLASSYKEDVEEIMVFKDYLPKVSQWIFGGDGWAYDIGYGGLDHVIANHEDVNILVVDTEVYSNTGGQSSKSSQTGSIAKFTSAGKPGTKKDLASIAMSYGHVYVATISNGASQAQVVKALREAESYNGPSLIIAYAPCIAHGIKGGLVNSINESKLATECGYFPTFRYDPRLAEEGKNPFQIDCKEPQWDKYNEFLMHETRYNQLTKVNPEKAEELLEANKKESQKRWAKYKRYEAMDWSL